MCPHPQRQVAAASTCCHCCPLCDATAAYVLLPPPPMCCHCRRLRVAVAAAYILPLLPPMCCRCHSLCVAAYVPSPPPLCATSTCLTPGRRCHPLWPLSAGRDMSQHRWRDTSEMQEKSTFSESMKVIPCEEYASVLKVCRFTTSLVAQSDHRMCTVGTAHTVSGGRCALTRCAHDTAMAAHPLPTPLPHPAHRIH